MPQSGTSSDEVDLLVLSTTSTENHPGLPVALDDTEGVEVQGEKKEGAEVEAAVFAAHVAVTVVVLAAAGVV